MTYVLNNADILPVPGNAKTALLSKTAVPSRTSTQVATGPTVWQRFYAALIQSRQRSAIRELRARNFLVNEAEIVLGGFPTATVSNDASLPFNR